MAVSARRGWLALVGLAVGLGLAVRIWAALQWQVNFDSDEAIFALMARHLLKGEFVPMLYGTGHIGSLESTLSALPMALFGQGVPVFRSSALTLMGIFMVLSAVFVSRHWGLRAAFLSLLFLAVPGFHILEWTYQPIGGYGALLVCGLALIALSERINVSGVGKSIAVFGCGVFVGLGLWSNQMMVVFALSVFLPFLLASSEWRSLWSSARRFAQKMQFLPFSLLAPGVLLLIGALGVGSLFVSACSPAWRFERITLASRIGLLAVVGGVLGLLLWNSKHRARRISEALILSSGVLAGLSPIWVGMLSGTFQPVNVVHRSCPTGVFNRVSLLATEILPAAWGVPPLDTWSTISWWGWVAWSLVAILILLAMLSFVWHERGC